jgi:hypothetical protein
MAGDCRRREDPVLHQPWHGTPDSIPEQAGASASRRFSPTLAHTSFFSDGQA